MKKDEVIMYFIRLKDETAIQIEDILYSDVSKSLTFKELQTIDHLRQNMQKIYNIISFLEKEIN